MIKGYVVEAERQNRVEIYSVNDNDMYRRLGKGAREFDRKAG